MAKKKTIVEIEDVYHEVVVEVPEQEPTSWGREAELVVVGKPGPRVEAADMVSGRAKYTHDINLPGMLYAKTLRSPYAHARIVRIDTRRAEALPGVKALLTHKDLSDMPWPFQGPNAKLLDTTLRYVGDEVAIVAAVDEPTAADAIRLIEVEYEELPFVLDPEKALEADAPKVWPEGNLLRGQPSVYERGNIAQGFAEADVVVEQTFRSQHQVHACAETHASVAQWRGNKLTVWDSTQGTHAVREQLAQMLRLPIANVRAITQHMGGGFGSKLWLNKYTLLAALLAKRTGRPVKMALEREEEALAMGNRPANIMQLKAGCKRDGSLTALYMKSIGTIGAYPTGLAVARHCAKSTVVRTSRRRSMTSTSMPTRRGHTVLPAMSRAPGRSSRSSICWPRRSGLTPCSFDRRTTATLTRGVINRTPVRDSIALTAKAQLSLAGTRVPHASGNSPPRPRSVAAEWRRKSGVGAGGRRATASSRST